MTSNGYKKPAPEPGLDALSDLLQGLHERGMSVGVDDAARVARAFALAQDWPREKRVRALKALLARSDDERRLLDQLAQFLFEDAPREDLPKEPVQPPPVGPDVPIAPPVVPPLTDVAPVVNAHSSSRSWVIAGAAAVGVAVVVYVQVVGKSIEAKLKSAALVQVVPDNPPPPPPPGPSYLPVCERQPDPAAQWRRSAVALSLLFGFGALGWSIGLVRRERQGRRQEQNVARVAASDGPRVYRFDVPDNEPPCPLEPSLARDAAFHFSAPQTEVSAAWIDDRATIEHTVKNLGILSLRYDRWREQAPVIVLEDVGCSMARWPLHGRQLIEALGRQGADVTHYFFDQEPGQIHGDRCLSQAMELDRVLSASPHATVIVVSDASGVEPARGGGSPWIGLLNGCLWLHPAPEALWCRGARWLGARLRVMAMSPEGLLRMRRLDLRPCEDLAPAWQPPQVASDDPLAVVCAWRGSLSRTVGSAQGRQVRDESAFWLLCAGALLSQRAGLTVRLLTALREQLIDAPWDLIERIWLFPTLCVGNDGTIQIDLALAEPLIEVFRREQPHLLQRVVDWATGLTTTASAELKEGSLAKLTARVAGLRLDAESATRREEALKNIKILSAQGFGDVISGYTSESERREWGVGGLPRLRRPTRAQWVGAAAATSIGALFALLSIDARLSAKLWPSEPRFTLLTRAGKTRVTDAPAVLSLAGSARPEVYLCDELWLDTKLEMRVDGEAKSSLLADRGVWDLVTALTNAVPPTGHKPVSIDFGYQGGKLHRVVLDISAPSKPTINPAEDAVVQPPKLPRPRMVQIPAGTFQMGSNDGRSNEKRIHPVKLAGFWMDMTEVTVTDYQTCVQAKRSGDARACDPAVTTWKNCNSGKPGRKEHPINCVNWHQARVYCAWAGKRLPTEDEWEYAARGTAALKYPWGNEAPGEQLCWNRSDGTCPVGSFRNGATANGVLDMAGNVWEWTETQYCDSYNENKKCTDDYVVRGGGWTLDDPSIVRAPIRYRFNAGDLGTDLGFRCAR